MEGGENHRVRLCSRLFRHLAGLLIVLALAVSAYFSARGVTSYEEDEGVGAVKKIVVVASRAVNRSSSSSLSDVDGMRKRLKTLRDELTDNFNSAMTPILVPNLTDFDEWLRFYNSTEAAKSLPADSNLPQLLSQAKNAHRLAARAPYDGQKVMAPSRFLRVPPSDICSIRRPFVVIVHTAPGNVAKRQAIRDSYYQLQVHRLNNLSSKNVRPVQFTHTDLFRLVFVVGQPENSAQNESLNTEMNRYQDFLQYDALDTYKALTVKMLAWLHFVALCRPSTLVVKLDDDVVFNPWTFVRWARDSVEKGTMTRETIACFVMPSNEALKRNYRTKWAHPFYGMPFPKAPQYCVGHVYVFSADRALDLYGAAHKLPYSHVDDLFLTGCVRQLVGMKLLNLGNVQRMWNQKRAAKDLLDGRTFAGASSPKGMRDIFAEFDRKFGPNTTTILDWSAAQAERINWLNNASLADQYAEESAAQRR